jgi:plasmid stability protein
MPQLTIRGVSDELGRRLARVSRERNQSMNALALEILEQAVGTSGRRRRLQRYATWSADEAAAFDRALAEQRVIDDDLWR